MEKIVRILEQSGLSTRKYNDKKTGQEKVMNAVTFKLTDGIDTFLGEITGERAVNCPVFDKNYYYRVQCSMVVRDWMSQQTGEPMHEKMQDSINKEAEELKYKHTETNNTITKIKNTLEGINSRISEAEE